MYFRLVATQAHVLSATSFHQSIVLMGVLAWETGQKRKQHVCKVTEIQLALRKERYLVNLDPFPSLQLMGTHCYG